MSKILPFANSNLSLTDEEREQMIEDAAKAYAVFMDTLKIDWKNDPNSADTPHRVAKSFVNEICMGCYTDPPKITVFDNLDKYDGVVCQNNCTVTSICSHHHLPFVGKAHVAYIPSKKGKVIGLSKINRIVDWFSRRPQVQENLTMQIHEYLDEITADNKGVAVMVEANHQCCSNRGVRQDSTMRTARMSGAFLDDNDNSRDEFYKFIEFSK